MSKVMTMDLSRTDAAVLGNLNVPIELRKHPSARRLTLRVSRARRVVVLTMPARCAVAEATNFLNRHMAWLQECLDALPSPVSFEHGALIPVRGQFHRLHFTGIARAKDVVSSQVIEGEQTPLLNVSGHLEHAPRRLRAWLLEQARTDLSERVSWHTGNLSLKARRITIRDQTTRWGSCSSSGCLSFSWRLILAPSYVLDYVAAHEVAHLAEMNHGPRFWQLVELTMPRMHEAKNWLREQGMDLHRYG